MNSATWFNMLSSAAVGSILALVAKEILDHFRARRDQRLELQKRFFEAKFQATLEMVPMLMRTAIHLAETANSFVNLSRRVDGGIIDAAAKARRELRTAVEGSLDKTAALFFVFDEELVRDYDRACSAPLHSIVMSLAHFDAQVASLAASFGDHEDREAFDETHKAEYRGALAMVLRDTSEHVNAEAARYQQGVEFMIARLRKEYRPYLV